MSSLSVCLIVKNEQDVLERCLSCAKVFADEIIVADTGSTDKTKEIAARFTDKIYDFPWIDDFSAARNFSFSKATMDFIMWLDADDVIDAQNLNALIAFKDVLNENVDMVMLKYNVGFDENGNPNFSYFRERIFRRECNFKWVGEIHEVIPPGGKILHSDIAILHKKIHANEPQRNLKIFEKILASGKSLDPRQQFYYARELYYNGRNDEAIGMFTRFLDDGQGWLENNISACSDLSRCYYTAGNADMALLSLVRSFTFAPPRAEICCDIAKHFLDRDQLKAAVFWYKTALTCERDPSGGGFYHTDCYNFIPYIQLSVCYDRLNDYKTANMYNESAGRIKPNNPGYLYNKAYFANLLDGELTPDE